MTTGCEQIKVNRKGRENGRKVWLVRSAGPGTYLRVMIGCGRDVRVGLERFRRALDAVLEGWTYFLVILPHLFEPFHQLVISLPKVSLFLSKE